jgi:hypothetical protein
MRIFLIALVGLALLSGATYASVPDPDQCSVIPPDNMAAERLIGVPATIGQSAANLTITIRASDGTAINNAYVEVILNPTCNNPDPLCVCNVGVFTGYTAPSGNLTLNMKYGGCCQDVSSAIIMAEGTPIRHYDIIVSPDYNGVSGNCAVQLADFVYFSGRYGQSNVPCSNFSGDAAEACTLADFVTFAGVYGKTCTGS